MEKRIHFLVLFSVTVFFFFCNDKGDNQPQPVKIPRIFSVKKIDCESNVELCNRKPGLTFTALAPVVEYNRPNWRLDLRVSYTPQPYTLTICCDTIPALIDSLNKMHALLENYRRDKPEKEEKSCQLPDGITISVFYSKDLAGTGEYSSMEFGKVADGSVFYIHTKDQFDKFMKDLNERFRTCCFS
jgi:hypothetical protein